MPVSIPKSIPVVDRALKDLVESGQLLLSDVTTYPTSFPGGTTPWLSAVGSGYVIASGNIGALAAASHTHVIANVTGLQGALDAKFDATGGNVTGSVNASVSVSAGQSLDVGATVSIQSAAGAGNNYCAVKVPMAGGGSVSVGSGTVNYAGLSVQSNAALLHSSGTSQIGTIGGLAMARQELILMGSVQLHDYVGTRNDPGLSRVDANTIAVTNSSGGANGSLVASTLALSGSSLSLTGSSSVVTIGNTGTGTNSTLILNGNSAGRDFRFATLGTTGVISVLNNPSITIGSDRSVTLSASGSLRFSNATDPSGTPDVSLVRNGTGQIDVRADNGLRVRNLANNADAAITAGTGTFSGDVYVSSTYGVVGNSAGRMYGFTGGLNIQGYSGVRLQANTNWDIVFTTGGSGRVTTSNNTLDNGSGAATFSGTVRIGTFTVATLPSAAANPGAEANVTNSSVTTFGATVAGGGSSNVKVRSNGTNWTVCGI